MAQIKISLERIAELGAEAVDGAVGGVAASLAFTAGELAARADRLKQAAERLEQQPEADPGEVAALEQAAAQAAALQQELQTLVAREAKRPKIAPDGWLVFGRALQPDGQPASGVRIRVADEGDTLEGLASAEPDAFGDFSVTYRRENFPPPPEQPPDLRVVVDNQSGQEIYRSGATVTFQEDRAEYVEITVREEPVKSARRARKGARKAAAPKRPGRSRSAKPGR